MAQASAQREPSMEEILASIRRIIEDSDGGGRKPVDFTGRIRPEGEADRISGGVIEVEAFRNELRARSLESQNENAEPAAGGFASEERVDSDTAGEDGPELHSTAEATKNSPSFEDSPAAADPGVAEDLDLEFDDLSLADDEGQQSEAAAAPVTRSPLLSDRAERQVAAAFTELSEAFAASRRKSFDQMAEEMLRPMLQDWLDNNLPILVERLVREEIERIARGGAQ